MDAERARAFLLKLPHVVETQSDTERWGSKLVFRTADRAIGGQMFAQFDFGEDGRATLSFAAGPERFHELLEIDGVVPAPYRARIHWVALERWNAFSRAELEALLRHAHAITSAKLPKRAKKRA
jgi:predicted DNA-binding protein (MmcQ/YjbR family)